MAATRELWIEWDDMRTSYVVAGSSAEEVTLVLRDASKQAAFQAPVTGAGANPSVGFTRDDETKTWRAKVSLPASAFHSKLTLGVDGLSCAVVVVSRREARLATLFALVGALMLLGVWVRVSQLLPTAEIWKGLAGVAALPGVPIAYELARRAWFRRRGLPPLGFVLQLPNALAVPVAGIALYMVVRSLCTHVENRTTALITLDARMPIYGAASFPKSGERLLFGTEARSAAFYDNRLHQSFCVRGLLGDGGAHACAHEPDDPLAGLSAALLGSQVRVECAKSSEMFAQAALVSDCQMPGEGSCRVPIASDDCAAKSSPVRVDAAAILGEPASKSRLDLNLPWPDPGGSWKERLARFVPIDWAVVEPKDSPATTATLSVLLEAEGARGVVRLLTELRLGDHKSSLALTTPYERGSKWVKLVVLGPDASSAFGSKLPGAPSSSAIATLDCAWSQAAPERLRVLVMPVRGRTKLAKLVVSNTALTSTFTPAPGSDVAFALACADDSVPSAMAFRGVPPESGIALPEGTFSATLAVGNSTATQTVECKVGSSGAWLTPYGLSAPVTKGTLKITAAAATSVTTLSGPESNEAWLCEPETTPVIAQLGARKVTLDVSKRAIVLPVRPKQQEGPEWE